MPKVGDAPSSACPSANGRAANMVSPIAIASTGRAGDEQPADIIVLDESAGATRARSRFDEALANFATGHTEIAGWQGFGALESLEDVVLSLCSR